MKLAMVFLFLCYSFFNSCVPCSGMGKLGNFGAPMLGPSDVVFKSVEECDEKYDGMVFEMTARRLDRKNFGMTMHMQSDYDVDDQVGLIMEGSRWADGGWKPGAWLMDEPDACKALKTLLGDPFNELLKSANVEDCPVPAGDYTVESFVFNNEKFNVPQVYGDYKMLMKAMKDNEVQACLTFYYEMVPKNG